MKTFKAQASFTEEQAEQFATSKGWVDQSNDLEAEQFITIDDFITNYIKENLINILGKETINSIKEQNKLNTLIEIQEYKDKLSNVVNVESV